MQHALPDGAHQSVSGSHQARAVQEDVLRVVGLLTAYWAEGHTAVWVVALLAALGGTLSDPVSPLGKAGRRPLCPMAVAGNGRKK